MAERTVGLTIAKPDKEDMQSVKDFFDAAELALDREKYSMCSPYEKWHNNLDDDDPDKILILKIRKQLAYEENMKEKEVDERLIMYQFLYLKFAKASSAWRRVYWAADILVSDACDPTEDHLAYHPGMERFHVAPEM